MTAPAKLPGEVWRDVVDGDLLAVVETPTGYAVRWWQDAHQMPARWREDTSPRQMVAALKAALGAERAKAKAERALRKAREADNMARNSYDVGIGSGTNSELQIAIVSAHNALVALGVEP